MGMLVDDLLNLGRVGRHEVRLQVTGLDTVVKEVLIDLQPESENRQVEWKIGRLPYVECDAPLMKQVFQNLLSNALKFTRPREHVVIEVGTQEQNGVPVVFCPRQRRGIQHEICGQAVWRVPAITPDRRF